MWEIEYIKQLSIKDMNKKLNDLERAKKGFKGLPLTNTTFLGVCWAKNWYEPVYNGLYSDIRSGIDADFFIMNEDFNAKVNKQFKITGKEKEFTGYTIYKLVTLIKIRLLKEARAKKSKSKKYAYTYEDEL